MVDSRRFVVDIVTRPLGDKVTRWVETPFGEYKAAAVAVVELSAVDAKFRYGKIDVRECVPGENVDPKRLVLDPWRSFADGCETPPPGS